MPPGDTTAHAVRDVFLAAGYAPVRKWGVRATEVGAAGPDHPVFPLRTERRLALDGTLEAAIVAGRGLRCLWIQLHNDCALSWKLVSFAAVEVLPMGRRGPIGSFVVDLATAAVIRAVAHHGHEQPARLKSYGSAIGAARLPESARRDVLAAWEAAGDAGAADVLRAVTAHL